MISKIKIFFSYPFSFQLLLVEVLFFLFFAKVSIKSLPFKRLSKLIGQRNKQTDQINCYKDQRKVLEAVSFAIKKISKNVFWTSLCLDQAIAAKWILKRRSISSILYFGVAKSDNTTSFLKAHAWLMVNKYSVTGGEGKEYRVIAFII